MKKSEFRTQRLKRHRVSGFSDTWYEGQIRLDVEAAEAAGVTWDPEGGAVQGQGQAPEPMKLPERLVVHAVGSRIMVPLRPEALGLNRFLFQGEAREAVRRYNEWPEMLAELDRMRRENDRLVEGGTAYRQRAEKAEAEVQRLGGVIARVKDLEEATSAWRDLHNQDRSRIAGLNEQNREQHLQLEKQQHLYRLLTAERDALKLAVQEGEAEVERLRGELREARELYDFSLEQRDHLRRHADLVQDFLSDDKETFKRALRELLRLAAEADGEEGRDGE